jgi:hypothetical protein
MEGFLCHDLRMVDRLPLKFHCREYQKVDLRSRTGMYRQFRYGIGYRCTRKECLSFHYRVYRRISWSNAYFLSLGRDYGE